MNHPSYANASTSRDIISRPSYPPHNQRVAVPSQHVPNSPIKCESGRFVGRTIRAEMDEIQKANIGRPCVFDPTPRWLLALNVMQLVCRSQSCIDSFDKRLKVDRRPIDPRPIVTLRIYEVHDAENGTSQEEKIGIDEWAR